jgi:hypothetical protein
MDGRLKITVIATGFQRAERAQRRRTATTPVDITHYAKGREATAGSSGFYRRGVSENLAADLDFGTTEGEEGEDLDVPTFLRKSR